MIHSLRHGAAWIDGGHGVTVHDGCGAVDRKAARERDDISIGIGKDS